MKAIKENQLLVDTLDTHILIFYLYDFGSDIMLIHLLKLNTFMLLNLTDIQPWWIKSKIAKVSAVDAKNKDPSNNWGICLTCFR